MAVLRKQVTGIRECSSGSWFRLLATSWQHLQLLLGLDVNEDTRMTAAMQSKRGIRSRRCVLPVSAGCMPDIQFGAAPAPSCQCPADTAENFNVYINHLVCSPPAVLMRSASSA
jgi:hypothetical protein